MLLILFTTALIVTETTNGFNWLNYANNSCIELIKEGGEIACNLTGQGHYGGMSIGNCWVYCTQRHHDFLLPPKQCERILRVQSWATYQKMFGELPPYGFEFCSERLEKSMKYWADSWKTLQAKVKRTMCPGEKETAK
ncbi:uncharacterized protein LOC120842841 [Ixodes scapularis]|uniref:uncharacterized protein LOC120842841 n=1 Tax=Ixodes scapularis TaxID=6945 RepID=UPI001A9EE805|nr:uncharacterized protein LOC120842841 [Ixodes scapularis]